MYASSSFGRKAKPRGVVRGRDHVDTDNVDSLAGMEMDGCASLDVSADLEVETTPPFDAASTAVRAGVAVDDPDSELPVMSLDRPHVRAYPGCGKRFRFNSKLETHARVHTDERPFEYDFAACGKRFSQRNNLKQHYRRHTGEGPCVCKVKGCGKGFSDIGGLSRHASVHNGERPFVCEVKNCGKRFKRSAHLQRHTGVHTGGHP